MGLLHTQHNNQSKQTGEEGGLRCWDLLKGVEETKVLKTRNLDGVMANPSYPLHMEILGRAVEQEGKR